MIAKTTNDAMAAPAAEQSFNAIRDLRGLLTSAHPTLLPIIANTHAASPDARHSLDQLSLLHGCTAPTDLLLPAYMQPPKPPPMPSGISSVRGEAVASEGCDGDAPAPPVPALPHLPSLPTHLVAYHDSRQSGRLAVEEAADRGYDQLEGAVREEVESVLLTAARAGHMPTLLRLLVEDSPGNECNGANSSLTLKEENDSRHAWYGILSTRFDVLSALHREAGQCAAACTPAGAISGCGVSGNGTLILRSRIVSVERPQWGPIDAAFATS